MGKNIVVFGCDNTGKTTLAQKIAFILGGQYVKSLGPNKTRNEQLGFMFENLDSYGIKIFDRFPIIEESTSGVVLRGHDNFQTWCEQEMDLLSKVDVFIFCNPGLFNTLNWGEREQLEGVKDHALELINKYNEIAVLLQQYYHNVIEYNYKANPVDEIFINNLKGKLEV